jgi:hypothetical protein
MLSCLLGYRQKGRRRKAKGCDRERVIPNLVLKAELWQRNWNFDISKWLTSVHG